MNAPTGSAAAADQAYVDGIVERSHRVQARAQTLAGGLTAEQLNWKSAPDRWSVAQCLDHLLETNGKYLVRIREACATARSADPARPFRPGAIGRRFAQSLSPEARRKLPAPGAFLPDESALPTSVLDDFLAAQVEFREMCERARTVDLTHTRIATPVSRWIRFRLGDVLMLLANHQERHLGQAERVVAHEEFPGTEDDA